VADGFKTVLLVEGEQQVMKLMLRLLIKENKYEVLTASGGEEALAVSRQAKCDIDLLITGIDIGKMNGVELYKNLKQQRPQIVVLFVSGGALEFRDLYPDWPLLRKPFSPEAFLSKVRETLWTPGTGAESC